MVGFIKSIFSAISEFFGWLRERRLVNYGRLKEREKARKKEEEAKERAKEIWESEDEGRFL